MELFYHTILFSLFSKHKYMFSSFSSLSDCSVTGDGYAALTSALKLNPSHLVELDLRGNDPGDSGVKLLTDLQNLVDDPNFKLKTLK